jgi:hypothetical protein
MAQTTSTTVANWLLTEVMSQIALDPLRGKYVLLPFLNMADISGRATKNRKIRKKTAIAAAVDDTEGSDFAASPGAVALGVASNITITPTTKVQGVELTTDAIELALPGVARSQVVAAIQSGNPSALPLVRDAMTEILEAHYLRAETDSLALFSGLSESASSSGANPTAAPLSFATLLDAMLKLLDNNPASEDMVFVLDEVGVGDLRTLAAGGSGAALSSIFTGNGAADLAFFNHRPDVSRNGFRGSFAGIPIYAGNKAIMATANTGGADRVGALIVAGRGETGAPGSVRGFAEMVERYEPSLGFQYDLGTDSLLAVGRWCWAVGEHTDEHGVKIIYDKT